MLPEDAAQALACQKDAEAQWRQSGAQPGRRPVCLLRGDSAPEILEAAEQSGILCVNPPAALRLAGDKLACAVRMQAQGIPVPAAVPLPSPKAAAREGSAALVRRLQNAGIPFPAVIKPRTGSRGRDVFLAHNAAEAAAFLLSRQNRRAGFLMQEYIPFSRGRDLRVFFAGETPAAVCMRENPAALHRTGEIRANVAAGGAFTACSGTGFSGGGTGRDAFLRRAVRIIRRELGLVYGAADFLFLPDGRLTLCEVNGSPGFEGLERTAGINIAGAVAEAVLAFSREAASAPESPPPVSSGPSSGTAGGPSPGWCIPEPPPDSAIQSHRDKPAE